MALQHSTDEAQQLMFFLRELPSLATLERYAQTHDGVMSPARVHRALRAMRQSSRRIRTIEQYFRTHALSLTQFLILILLDRQRPERPLSPTSLSEALDVSRPVVTDTTAKLVQRGLLERRRDPSDGRGRVLAITAAGRARLAELLPGYWARVEGAILDARDEPPQRGRSLIVGAQGRIGRRVVRRLAERGPDTVRALVRRPEDLGVPTVRGDVLGPLQRAFEGVDSVVFTAGSGAETGDDQTLLVDLWGARRAMAMAEQVGARRFVLVSSIGVDDPLGGPSKLRPYLVAKRAAEEALTASDLAFTILRPGRLTDEPASGHLARRRPDGWPSVSRADVADVIVACFDEPRTVGRTIDVCAGPHPIADVLARRPTGEASAQGHAVRDRSVE